jgi:ribonucleoside-diphosphate reductase alpha chain
MHRVEEEPEFESEEVVGERVVEPEKKPSKAFATPRSGHLHPIPENGNGHKPTLEVATVPRATLDMIRLARMKGYEGDPCSECGQLTLIRSGACCKCDTCGASSGCS